MSALPTDTVRVSEIFYSLQGEASRVGLPTVFVRLTGCPLRCLWCDTAHAFDGGEVLSIAAVLGKVKAYPARQVCVTGGEPLAQKNSLPLMSALCDAGFEVSLETSGALDIAATDPRVSRIVDLKAPDSGESSRNLWSNLAHLKLIDELKIVVASRADYEWAKTCIEAHDLTARCSVLMSPVQGVLPPLELAEWILADGLAVRFQLQLHKILWGNVPGK